jgi:hypothetical protein
MHLHSREYQHRLKPESFADIHVAVQDFLKWLGSVHPKVHVNTRKLKYSSFTRDLLDTPSGAFTAKGLKLRVRRYDTKIACCYKAVALDRYVAKAADVEASAQYAADAVTKYEEGIYALHSAFSKQTTLSIAPGWRFDHVSDWISIFPGAGAISSGTEPLTVTNRVHTHRFHKIVLEFANEPVEAMLEIGFAPDSTTPQSADFSWKYRRTHGKFLPEFVSLMREFSKTLNNSDWADLSVHLKKALVNAGASWSAEFFQGMSQRAAGSSAVQSPAVQSGAPT